MNLDFEIGEEPLRVLADPVQIEQVLLNLCVNASHAMTIMRPGDARQGGTISVSGGKYPLRRHTCPTHPDVNPDDIFIRIRVSDSGVGMDEDVRRNIFDPFFTTKEIRRRHRTGARHHLQHCETARRIHRRCFRSGRGINLHRVPAGPRQGSRARWAKETRTCRHCSRAAEGSW